MQYTGRDWHEVVDCAIKWYIYTDQKCRVTKWSDGKWHTRVIMKLTPKNRTRFYPLAEVIEVHDGDTIRLRIDCGFNNLAREWIRLLDVRAPELKEGQPALAAKQHLLNWLHDYALDRVVAVTTYQVETMIKEIREKQTFIRYIGTITPLDGTVDRYSLNEYMRNLGYTDQGD